MVTSNKPLKASVAAVKRIPGWNIGGWGTFKMRLADALGVHHTQYDDWDVPQEWINAFQKACGR